MRGRRALLRWIGWFAAANGAIFALVGLRYMASYPIGTADALGVVYAVLAFISHFALLAALPLGLVAVPLALLIPNRRAVTVTAVLLSGLSLTLLVVDTNVFAEQRYHLTPLTALLFEPGTWIFVGVIGVSLLAFEALLAGYVWRWIDAGKLRRGRLIAAILCLAWLSGQGIHIWADAIGHTPVTQLTRYLPAYLPIHAKRTLARLGWLDPAVIEKQRLLRRTADAAAGQLDYPKAPLQCRTAARPANILWILIDALRPDAIDSSLMPNLARLRDEGLNFANHWSGGNSSKAGLFSMFYGLPSTYMETFYGVQRPPVLIDELRRRAYDLALFAAPGFSAPTDIGRTVFAGIPGLPGERSGISAVERNREVTNEWLSWLARRDNARPFFGFLYYDPPMGEMSDDASGLPLDERFTSSERARRDWQKYRRAMQMADGEVGRVLSALAEAAMVDETLVIVVSDHGYEFDDNRLGYFGHASNYSRAQLRATFVMSWPGRASAVYRHRTSHYDLPVTLMQDVFGCTNDPTDHAVGKNLFEQRDWEWILAGSYNSHAIVEPERVIVTHPGGFVEVLGADYRPLENPQVDTRVVAEALGVMRRYYR